MFGVDICICLGNIARKRERDSKAPNTFVEYCSKEYKNVGAGIDEIKHIAIYD